MQHVELHVMNTSTDAETAEFLGLIEFNPVELCENCSEPVAFDVDGTWIPCVLVMMDVDDEDVLYLLCTYCTQPVLDPLR